MPFKPVGIDDDGNLPARARSAIAADIAAVTNPIAADVTDIQGELTGRLSESSLTASQDTAIKAGTALAKTTAASNDTTDASATLASEDAAAASFGAALHLPKGTYRIGSDLTLSSALSFAPGAVLKPDSGVTVTLAGQFSAPARQVFDVSAGGVVVFGAAATVDNGVLPQWFGAVRSNIATHQAALAAAINSLGSSRLPLHLTAGDWYVSASLTPPGRTIIQGDGMGATRLRRTADVPILSCVGDAYTGSGAFFPTHWGLALSDLTLRDASGVSGYTSPLMDMRGTSNGHFFSVQWESYTGAPLIDMRQVFDSHWVNCQFAGGGSYDSVSGATVGALQLYAGDGVDGSAVTYRQTNNVKFVNCWWEQYAGPALKASRPSGYTTSKVEDIDFSNCKMESRITTGPHLQLEANDVNFQNTYVNTEQTSGPVVDLAPVGGTTGARGVYGELRFYVMVGDTVFPSCFLNVPTSSAYINLRVFVSEPQDPTQNVVTVADPTERTISLDIDAQYPLVNGVNVKEHVWRGGTGNKTLFIDSNKELRLSRSGLPSGDTDGSLVAGIERKMRPTGLAVQRETVSRTGFIQSQNALTSGRITFAAIALEKGDIVSAINFISGSTAAVSPTNQWFALYDSSGTKLAVTADDTTAAWGALARKSLALTTPYTVTASGIYYVGCMVAASTVPSLAGVNNNVAIVDMAPRLCSLDSNTGLTVPAGAPATWGTQAAQQFLVYAQVSS